MLQYSTQQLYSLQGYQCLPLPDFGRGSYQKTSLDGCSDDQKDLSLSTQPSSPESEPCDIDGEPQLMEEQRLQSLKKMKEELMKWHEQFKVVDEVVNELVVEVVNPVKITNKEATNFLADLTKQMDDQKISFENLTLNFARCFNINDQGIKAIAAHIGKHFRHLHSLTLNFQLCDKITNKGVIELAQIIGTDLPSLIHFSLDLYKCDKISDESVRAIAKKIGCNLRGLRRFELNLQHCWKVTSESVKALSTELANLENLELLLLNFRLCYEIRDAEIQDLAREIELNLKNLTTFSLNVKMCKNISQEAVEAIQNSLNYLKHFELIF